MGQYEISKYIPQYLGEAALYLHPSELDEQVLWLKTLLGFTIHAVAVFRLSKNTSLVMSAPYRVSSRADTFRPARRRMPLSAPQRAGRAGAVAEDPAGLPQ